MMKRLKKVRPKILKKKVQKTRRMVCDFLWCVCTPYLDCSPCSSCDLGISIHRAIFSHVLYEFIYFLFFLVYLIYLMVYF